MEDVEPTEQSDEQRVLPRSYGTQSVWLMPRDPHSIFAYWDVDWHLALGEKLPTNRKAQLRLFGADGSQLTRARSGADGGQLLSRRGDADESYTAELGYYSPAGTWNSVATSPTATTPPGRVRSERLG
jgi:hypothetical protein